MLVASLLRAALPLVIVLAQTYYMNFVFNNNLFTRLEGVPLNNGSANSDGNSGSGSAGHGHSHEHKNHTIREYYPPIDPDTIELEGNYDEQTPRVLPDNTEELEELIEGPDESVWIYPPTHKPHPRPSPRPSPRPRPSSKRPPKTTDAVEITANIQSTKKLNTKKTAATRDTSVGLEITTESTNGSQDTEKVTTPTDFEFTTESTNTIATADGNETSAGNIPTMDPDLQELTTEGFVAWSPETPHPPTFFDYPEAVCHEDMDLHELFGIALLRDRGLAAKVLCEFRNSWGGPWLLMYRMDLPARVHMRHWFFGYVTEDYKDLNINYLGLAHLINNMRISMLIIGQDNNNESVYNLYDDVVISGFNDLFMLRKAHLVEANTTDLLFLSVGEVMEMYTGRNRSCPFQMLGGWWGHHLWGGSYETFCVFPVDRNVEMPGYMAIFIKPSPFPVNDTALYDYAVTTRRPWKPTISQRLFQQANENKKKYNELLQEEFHFNKSSVQKEIQKRIGLYKNIEAQRKANQTEQN